MARKRMIDPEFWTNEGLMGLSYQERLFFLGLICNADDEGFVKANPLFLKAVIFPYDQITPEEMCEMRSRVLDAFDTLNFYEEDGKEYIQIQSWLKFQKLKRPVQSKHPRPKKKAVPQESRRELARRAGLDGIGSIEAPCHWCGKIGNVNWMTASWVHFSDLEIDHIIPESQGGDSSPDNLVLSCRGCNRKKNNALSPKELAGQHQVSTGSAPSQPQGIPKLAPEGKGREGKGKEENHEGTTNAIALPPDEEKPPPAKAKTEAQDVY